MGSKTESITVKLAGVLGAFGGLAIGRYAGFTLIIPVAIAGGIYAVASRRVTGSRRVVIPAAAVVLGHLSWIILGGFVTGQLSAVWLDLVVLGAAVVWLLKRPGRAPLWALAALQAAAIVANAATMAGVEFGTLAHKALTVHIALRITSIVLSGVALHRLSQLRVASESSPGQTAPAPH